MPRWVVDQAESEHPTKEKALVLTATGQWRFSELSGDFGRLYTYIQVEGHPRFDAIRFCYYPGSHDSMAWVSESTPTHEVSCAGVLIVSL